MKRVPLHFIACATLSCIAMSVHVAAEPASAAKPTAGEALAMLKAGNERFVAGASAHPHMDAARIQQAAHEDQGRFAYATILSCSDSRVPVEAIFDTGIMDIFVVRVAGNVCDTDEAGSIEYGLAHVKTPLLVVLGHTQCGAVTAVASARHGHEEGHALEANIVPLIENIKPAVERASEAHPGAEGKELVTLSVYENVRQSVKDLLACSEAVRELVAKGEVRIVGAVYHLETGEIEWLPEEQPQSGPQVAE